MQLSYKAGVVLAGLVGLALVGCNAPTPEAETTTTETIAPETSDVEGDVEGSGPLSTYQCPDGEIIEADFTNPQAVVVTLPDQEPITLAQVEAASGAKYSDGTTTFWNKGEQAMVDIDGETVLSDCTAQ